MIELHIHRNNFDGFVKEILMLDSWKEYRAIGYSLKKSLTYKDITLQEWQTLKSLHFMMYDKIEKSSGSGLEWEKMKNSSGWIIIEK